MKIQELAFVLHAQDHLSGVLKNVSKSISGIDQHVAHLDRTARGIGPALGSLGAGMATLAFVRSSVNTAVAEQAENARVMTAEINDGAAATSHLAEVQKFAIATSGRLAITQGELKESYNMARFSGLAHAAALAATSAGAKLAIGTTATVVDAQAQAIASTRMLATTYQIFGDKSKAARPQIEAMADSYARLQMSANFANQGELNEALTQALGVSKAYHVGLATQNAILATLANSGKFRGEAGTGYEELAAKLSASNKKMAAIASAAGGDFMTELGMIKAATAGLGDVQKAVLYRQHGFEMRSVQGLSVVLDQYDTIRKAVGQYGAAAKGANDKLFAVRSNAADEKLAIFTNNLENLKEALGSGLLPMLTSLAVKGAAFAGTLGSLATAYPTIAKLTLGFVGVSAAIAAISGTLQLLGVGRALTLTWSAATKVMTAGQWLLNGALAANPIAIAVIAAAALAVAAYEIYEHWSAVAAFFRGTWAAIVKTLGGLAASMYTAGAHFMHAIARGMESAEMAPVHAVADLAKKIRSYLPFSPAEVGPLRDLHRVRIIETIAATMKPAPMLAAIRRVAQVAAVGIPMAMAAPALSFAGAPGAGAGGATVVHFTPNITIHAASGDPAALKRAVVEAMRESAHEVSRILASEDALHDRAKF